LRRGLHRSILAAVRSLPSQLTSFVGRAPALEAVSHRMGEHRLVSVVGPGGCGKTRLAIEVGQRGAVALKSFCFVDLSGLSDPELVPVAALTALGLTEALGASPLETLVALLAERELGIILDNCEHLIAACAALVVALISNCPGLRLLATSRERLGVPGEAVVDLGGLELPGPGGRDEAWLLRSEAGRLFVERARTARAGFALKGDDAVIVASICEHLDGIPLALEMAATRVRMLSVQAIAEGLSDRFKLLSGDRSAGAARQRSLLASVQWSCGLLVEAERQVLHRLSVFASGFTVAAAETVCTGGEVAADQVFSLLSSLVEKSLVQASPEVERLRLHETMRAYAASALEAEGATSAVRDRHLDYFATLARCWEPKMVTSEFLVARGELEPELDNLRSALDWSVESEQFATGAAFLSSVGSFFWELGFNSEAVARCETFLSADIEPSLRGDLLYLASRCSRLTDPPKSQRLAWELLCLGRSLGDQRMEAGGLVALAVMQLDAEPAAALGAATEGIGLARAAGEQLIEVRGLYAKGWALIRLGRPSEALAVGEEGLRAASDCDWPYGRYLAGTVICWSAMCTGELGRALVETEGSVGCGTSPVSIAGAGALRAEVLAYRGEAGAADLVNHAVSIVSAMGDSFFVANYGLGQGRILLLLGQEDAGYEILERIVAKLEPLGLFGICLENRALLAEVAIRRGDLPGARRHLDACSWRLPRAVEPVGAPVLRAEARLARAQGEPVRAHALACDGLSAALEGGHMLWAVDLLELVSLTCADLGSFAEAARLLGAAERQRDLIGYVRPAPARHELAPPLVVMRTALGDGPFDQAVLQGRALGLGEAVAYARRRRGPRRRPSSGWDSLTASEQQVVSLVGEHLTNAEIAKRLFVSTVTVKSHLSRVFAKLGVANRAQLAAAVQRRRAPRL